MHLKCVRLSGFKSFAEATSAEFRNCFSAVVGPNGCGKSNILDAVRWVIGERSLRTMRSASMNDVIFSGAGRRGACGRASVELLFDNADGGFGGAHAVRAEITVRRELERDGDSHYFLLGERCRRRDVLELFLGTGLGDRSSYAIVGQGMIARLVEAHPRELRGQIEEAAGISLYRERRRETESRLERARYHLVRLNDLRGELAQRLQSLSRQAEQARRHTELRAEERRLRASGFVLRYRGLVSEETELERTISGTADDLSHSLSVVREVDAERESWADRSREIVATLERHQGRCYELATAVARLESARSDRQQRVLELDSEAATLAEEIAETQRQLTADETEGAALCAELERTATALCSARGEESEVLAIRQRDEERLWATQARWEEASSSASLAATESEGVALRLAALRTEAERLAAELQLMTAEEAELLSVAAEAAEAAIDVDGSVAGESEPEHRLSELLASLPAARERIAAAAAQLHRHRCHIEDLSGHHAALKALLSERLPDSPELQQWLADAGLDSTWPLAASLELQEGWLEAVELVLGERLRTLCVADIDGLAERLSAPPQPVQLLQLLPHSPPPDDELLCSKLLAPAGLGALLWGVYAVSDVAAAHTLLARLEPGESVVSRDGWWLGHGWMRIAGPEEGVLQLRERAEALSRELAVARGEEAAAQEEQAVAQASLIELELRTERLREAVAQRVERRSELRIHRERVAALESQQQRLGERRQREERSAQAVEEARPELEQSATAAVLKVAECAALRDQLALECKSCREAMANSDRRATVLSEAVRRQALAEAAQRSRLEALGEAMERLRERGLRLGERREELAQRRAQLEEADPRAQEQLQQQLAQLHDAEQERDLSRRQLTEVEQAQRSSAERRVVAERDQRTLRDQLENQRVRLSAVKAEQVSCTEQVVAMELVMDELLSSLPDSDPEVDGDQQLARIERLILRLGPVNLAADTEYSEQLERKDYFDQQHAEASSAMERLQGAIARIDSEARRRFDEAFQKINEYLGELFSHLFGGGLAELRLEPTAADGEEPGILVMAHPPGKKNRNIRQLSGGEKSLTAVALVFALFRLNPAPFCMLDEVDAQLDDINAARFADLVEEMAKEVQIICISHNRIVMERANQLLGVTMSEPGVSRLVSVDMAQALADSQERSEAQLGG